MRRAIILSAALAACWATAVAAQSPMSYDPFLVLPGSQGGLGVDAGMESANSSKIADMSDVYLMAKYAVTDRIEAGARITMGFLSDRRDTISDAVIGAKWGRCTTGALTADVTVFNEAEKIGVAAGYMQAMVMGGMDVNSHLQLGMLEGYAADGVEISLRIEPRHEFSEQLAGYLNVMLGTNTDGISDHMALDLNPNLDYVVSDVLIVNGGISLGLAGKMKQDDVGIGVAAIYVMPMR